jgi:hypothetical protein
MANSYAFGADNILDGQRDAGQRAGLALRDAFISLSRLL